MNLNFKKFLEIQNIDKSKIICCECNNNKYFYGDNFMFVHMTNKNVNTYIKSLNREKNNSIFIKIQK